jgi:hypothetical protein
MAPLTLMQVSWDRSDYWGFREALTVTNPTPPETIDKSLHRPPRPATRFGGRSAAWCKIAPA